MVIYIIIYLLNIPIETCNLQKIQIVTKNLGDTTCLKKTYW